MSEVPTRLAFKGRPPKRGAIKATAMIALAMATSANAQSLPDDEAAAEARAIRQNLVEGMPDLQGTGPYPSIKTEDRWFPDHVLYRPADLGRTDGRLPILLWGNGGCRADGASARQHLLEVASHGYFAVAAGQILSGPGAPPIEQRPVSERRITTAPQSTEDWPVPETTWQDVMAGLDQAIEANTNPESPYFGRIDTENVAVGGHSCGGGQALFAVTQDARIDTVMVHNAGVFNQAPPPDNLHKSDLADLIKPMIYIIGGPTDIAYEHTVRDFPLVVDAPFAYLNIDVGHGGTFLQPNGGAVAQVSVDWLDWQLKGSEAAARRFVGPDCILCSDPEWTYQRKNIE